MRVPCLSRKNSFLRRQDVFERKLDKVKKYLPFAASGMAGLRSAERAVFDDAGSIAGNNNRWQCLLVVRVAVASSRILHLHRRSQVFFPVSFVRSSVLSFVRFAVFNIVSTYRNYDCRRRTCVALNLPVVRETTPIRSSIGLIQFRISISIGHPYH